MPTISHSGALLLAMMALSAGCDRALVYGERSGLNIAVRTDAAEGHPLESNIGMQRRVVGFVPSRGRSENDGQAKGEAVNMLSRFDIRREGNQGEPLNSTITIRSSFFSGASALEAASNPAARAAITEAPKFTVSSDPGQKTVETKLIGFLAGGEDKIGRYLDLAREGGLKIADGETPGTQALGTINDRRNAAGNKAIVELLGL